MADFEDVQNSLVTRLENLAAEYKFLAFEVAVPQGFKIPMDNHFITPYVLISFGGLSPVAYTNQGITGTKDNLRWTSVAFECVGGSQRDVRKLAKIIRQGFDGYIPDERWGELVEQLSGDYTVLTPDSDLWPVRYASGLVFNTNANA